MTTAFCPGHITCFFKPERADTLMKTGSRGVGVKISKGAYATLEERTDNKLRFSLDGENTKCWIAETAIRKISERGFDVTIRNEVPQSHGFGMSAAGCIAATMCACEIEGKKIEEAFEASHEAEIVGGGGLGDVVGIMTKSHVPIRAEAGFPPYGKLYDSKLEFKKMTLVVFDGELSTRQVLASDELVKKISLKGTDCVDAFMKKTTDTNLFNLSREFSSHTGLETKEISKAIDMFPRAAMCMLGYSIFTDEPVDVVEEKIPNAEIIECSSTDKLPFICKV